MLSLIFLSSTLYKWSRTIVVDGCGLSHFKSYSIFRFSLKPLNDAQEKNDLGTCWFITAHETCLCIDSSHNWTVTGPLYYHSCHLYRWVSANLKWLASYSPANNQKEVQLHMQTNLQSLVRKKIKDKWNMWSCVCVTVRLATEQSWDSSRRP